MRRQFVLLGSMFLSSGSLFCSQVPVDPKVQQLKDAWYQKAQELADLGERVIAQNKQLEGLRYDIQEFWREIFSEYSKQEIDNATKTCEAAMANFCHNLTIAVREKINVKGFLIKELFDNTGDCFTDKKQVSRLFFDRVKFCVLQMTIRTSLLKKLVEDYEECLQKMTEIENELVLLGQQRLFE